MFYTDFFPVSCDVLMRGYDSDGKRFITSIPNSPTIYLPSKNGRFLSVTGKRCEELKFDNIYEANKFINDFKGMENVELYGFEPEMQHYAIINDYFGPEPIQFDFKKIVILNFDIEVWSGDGFPDPNEADSPIISFAGSINGKKFLIAYDDYNPPKDVKFIKVATESQLLLKVTDLFRAVKPDILTGWNIEFFDIPYLINRIKKKFSYNTLRLLSPFEEIGKGAFVTSRNVVKFGKTHNLYEINGITILDYIDVYKKFTYHDQPSYKLDYIADVELGYGKLDYSEYSTIHEFYLNDKQKFFDYNIRDVEIVDELEKKFGFLNLIVSMALDARTRFKDVLGTVRYSDVYIHNFLHKKGLKIQMRLENDNSVGRIIKGAYVKQPEPGKYTNIISFDLASMYPHLIMQYNISPETIVGKSKTLYEKSLQSNPNIVIDFLIEKLGTFTDKLKSENVGMTANGLFFRNDKRGFLPEVMEMIFNDRKKHKKAMIEAEEKVEKLRKNGGKQSEIEKWESIATKENVMQMAKKIQMNAIYGAIVNKYFRWYDPDMGEAITLSGQLSIKYAEYRLNKFLNERYGLDIDWVVAGDTDSLYLTLDKIIEYHNVSNESIVDFMNDFGEDVITPEIEKLYSDLAIYMNAYAQKMFMKREIIATSAIWTAKKRYAMLVNDSEGVRYETPKIKIKGLEPIRSSTPAACRPKIMDAIGIMLQGNQKELWEFVENFRDEFETLGFEEIGNATTVNNLIKYTIEHGKWAKKTPFHVRGAIVFNHLRNVLGLEKIVDEIKDGDKAFFCILKMPNPADSDVITGPYLPKEFGLDEYLDYDAQFQKNFIKPIESMAHVIGWKVEQKGDISEWF